MSLATPPRRTVAIAECLLVTLIWASSFILVKKALLHLGPLTIAGLRYWGGALLLFPLFLHNHKAAPSLSRAAWIQLSLIGVSAYTVGNGALFWSLQYLPATTVSLLMSLLPVLILVLGALWLKEIPSLGQMLGVLISVGGSVLFFSQRPQADEWRGFFIIVIAMAGFTLFAVLGRALARDTALDTLSRTTIPLAIGGGLLLLIAFFIEGCPTFTLTGGAIVGWLALVNTALAYLLYNHALQTLPALEMNMLLNLAPLGTALLAWLLLAEQLQGLQIVGMITMLGGVILVQQSGKQAPQRNTSSPNNPAKSA